MANQLTSSKAGDAFVSPDVANILYIPELSPKSFICSFIEGEYENSDSSKSESICLENVPIESVAVICDE